MRHEAGEALGAIGTTECLEQLKLHIDDPCLEVRYRSVLLWTSTPSGRPHAAVTTTARQSLCKQLLDEGRDPIATLGMSLLACRSHRPASWLCSASSTSQRSRTPASSLVSPATYLWIPPQQPQPAPLCRSWRPHWWMIRAGSSTGGGLHLAELCIIGCKPFVDGHVLQSAVLSLNSTCVTCICNCSCRDKLNLAVAPWLHLLCIVLHVMIGSLLLAAGIAPCLPCATGAGQPRCKP